MQTNAGRGSGFNDDAYTGAGAGTIETSEVICERCGEYGGMKHFFCFTSCRTKGRRKVKMGKIVILANDRRCRAAYMDNARLPAFYMGDYSVLGLLVAPYAEAVRILDEKGYQIKKTECSADIHIKAPAQVAEIQRFLHAHGIDAEMADVVDAVYQA